MMEYITAQHPYFPGALTDDAVTLFRSIQADWMFIPDPRSMSKAQLDALHLLVKSGYIISSGWYGFRARGTERGWMGYAKVETPAIARISVFKHRVMIVNADGTYKVHAEGTPEHTRLVALAKTMPVREYRRHTEVTIYKWAS